MTTCEVLRAARKLIEDPGDWRQGDYFEGGYSGPATGPYCMVGACVVATGLPDPDEAIVGIEQGPVGAALMAATGSDWLFPSTFNDASERTHAEVLAVFDAAILNEQAREAEWTASPAAGVPDRLPVA